MKKFANLPIYFMLGGLILNIAMFFYNKVSFTTLMIRSSMLIILFAATGYFLAYVLREASLSISNLEKQKAAPIKEMKEAASSIDIRVNSDEDDELFKLASNSREEEFAEISVDNFKKLMEKT